MSDNIIKWMLEGETGLSSKCMARVALRQRAQDEYGHIDHPSDPADLNRCIKLLNAAPEVRDAFPKIAALSPQWKAVIENWDALVTMFHEEVGEDWSKKRMARKTYGYMNRLLHPEDAA